MKKIITTLLLSLVLLVPSVFSFSVELIKTDPAPVIAGEYADITLRFTNNDETANSINDVSFKIDETDFILPVSNNNERIEKVFQGETFTRTFRVFFSEDLEQGTINLPLTVSSDNKNAKYEVNIFVEDSQRKPELFVGQVETIPSELLPDTKDNKLIVTLQNLGEKDAELLSAELVLLNEDAKAAYSYSLIDSVASIDGGTQNNLEFVLDIEEEATEKIEAKLNLNYRAEKAIGNTYDIYTEELPLDIPLTEAPRLVIDDVEVLDSFEPGSTENKVRITLKNIGSEEANEVRIRLTPDISYPFTYQQLTEYVTSTIGVGETAVVEYEIEVLKDATAKDYSVTAIIESLVGETRYSREDSFSITVEDGNPKDTQTIGKILIGLIIVCSIIIGFMTFSSRRKSKSKKK